MSSPIHHGKGLDTALMYAPPWVRDQAGPAPAPPEASPSYAQVRRPQFAGSIKWPPRNPRRDGAMFSGDLAVLDLQRRLTLDRTMLPVPARLKPDRAAGRTALRICVLAGAAALIAWALVLPPGARQIGEDTVQARTSRAGISADPGKQDQLPIALAVSAPAAPARLSVHDGRAAANEKLPAGVELAGNAAGATVVFSGLAGDTRLSAGSPLGTNGWRVDARELDHLLVQPPPDFVGTMNVAVDLRLASDRLADSRVVHFEWSKPVEAASVPVPAPAPAPAPAPSSAPTRSEANAGLRLDQEEIATLLKRGRDFFRNGDLASARLLLLRAAEAGSADAALALGRTFDPAVIRGLGAIGVEPDAAQAGEWYRKAAELGSDVASRQLSGLVPPPR